jgi:predicted dithiol-disulfide oxidoreductase (DUF899 family)
MTTSNIEHPRVVSPDEWLAARKELLAKEKQLTRQHDALSAERRKLPWTKVEKNYVSRDQMARRHSLISLRAEAS